MQGGKEIISRDLEASTILIQGLTGVGLVGYTTARTLISAIETKKLRTFSEFTPTVAVVHDGNLIPQSIELYRGEIGEKVVYILSGPQPEESILNSLFIKEFSQVIKDFEEKINIYLSFGAFIQPFDLPIIKEGQTPIGIAEELIAYEVSRDRKMFVAVAGGLTLDKLKNLSLDKYKGDLVQQDSEGYISGLNGVLPAHIATNLSIPTATVMVSTTVPNFIQGTSPLSQYLGFLSSQRALKFLGSILDRELSAKTLEKSLKSIQPLALEQLTRSLQLPREDDMRKEPRREMYV